MLAITEYYKVRFHIISVGHADLMIGDEDAKYGTLMVCFSHGNHYDLVLTQERVQRLAFAQVCNNKATRVLVLFFVLFSLAKNCFCT